MADTSHRLNDAVSLAVEHTFRHESGQVLATLLGWLGDFQRAEDALQEAVVASLDHWPREGIPTKPGAWLTMVARRKAIDRLRRDAKHLGQISLDTIEAAIPAEPEDLHACDEFPDERLKLIFTCCHPALPLESQVALTLHSLGGLTTTEIARAFLVPVPTIAQRLVRAKRKIKDAGIPYEVSPAHRIAERLEAVFHVRMIEQLAQGEALRDFHPFYVAYADMLHRAGRVSEARATFLKALDLASNVVERNALLQRLQEMSNNIEGSS